MSHKVFIRHTYIYKCSNPECKGEWKINEASDLDRLSCPHCGKNDVVDYTLKDQRDKWISKRV
jgi:DNA-directed RNA polymerase subunit RPC12/RpoP